MMQVIDDQHFVIFIFVICLICICKICQYINLTIIL